MSRLGEGWWLIGLSLGFGCWDGAGVAEWGPVRPPLGFGCQDGRGGGSGDPSKFGFYLNEREILSG